MSWSPSRTITSFPGATASNCSLVYMPVATPMAVAPASTAARMSCKGKCKCEYGWITGLSSSPDTQTPKRTIIKVLSRLIVLDTDMIPGAYLQHGISWALPPPLGSVTATCAGPHGRTRPDPSSSPRCCRCSGHSRNRRSWAENEGILHLYHINRQTQR